QRRGGKAETGRKEAILGTCLQPPRTQPTGATKKAGRPCPVRPALSLNTRAFLQTVPAEDRFEGYARRFYNIVQGVLVRAVLEENRKIEDRHQGRQDRQAQLAGGLGSWLPIGKPSARFQCQAAGRIGGVPATKVIPRSGRQVAN